MLNTNKIKPRILIIGGSKASLCLIEASKRLGYQVVVIDRNINSAGMLHADQALHSDITETTECIEALTKCPPNGVMTTTDFGLSTLAAIIKKFKLPGYQNTSINNFTNKALMRDIWNQQGCDKTKFGVATSISQAEKLVKKIGLPVICKPVRSMGGSRGVSSVSSLKDLPTSFKFAMHFSKNNQIIIEECHIGTEHSAEIIVENEEAYIIAIGDKVKIPPPYRVDKSVDYPSSISVNELDIIKPIIEKAVLSLAPGNGTIHLEFCRKPDTLAFFEAAPRCGGGATASPIVPYVTGINLAEIAVHLCLGNKVNVIAPTTSRGCSYRFLTPGKGILESVTGLDVIENMEGILEFDIFHRPGCHISNIKTGLDRAGYIVTGAQTKSDAIALANQAESILKFHLKNES